MIAKGVSGHPDENPTQPVLVSFPSENCKQIPEISKTFIKFKFKLFLYRVGRYPLCYQNEKKEQVILILILMTVYIDGLFP